MISIIMTIGSDIPEQQRDGLLEHLEESIIRMSMSRNDLCGYNIAVGNSTLILDNSVTVTAAISPVGEHADKSAELYAGIITQVINFSGLRIGDMHIYNSVIRCDQFGRPV